MTGPPNEGRMDRREFLSRATKAGAAVAVAGGLAWWRWDALGPSGFAADQAAGWLGDFSAPQTQGLMAIVTGADRARTVQRAFAALGGVEKFIRPGDRVLLKVNAAFATPAVLSATTNPQLVGEVARLCLRAGAASVAVTDNSINDPQSCFAISGLAEAAAAAGASVLLPREGLFRPRTIPGGRLIRNWPVLCGPLEKVNRVIGIAPLKHHARSGASMCMKNWYGLLGGRRNVFHQDIHGIIRELSMLLRPTAVILDATTAMMANGPTGGSLDDLKRTDTMIVSTDQVAADAFGATLLGKTAADLPYIQMAAQAGAGTADFESLRPRRAQVTGVAG